MSCTALSGKTVTAVVFLFKHDAVNIDAPVFSISPDTFHAVVADLFRIEIAAVTLTAAYTLSVVQHTLLMHSHRPEHLLFDILYIVPERTVKFIHDRIADLYGGRIPSVFQTL